ncbi:hypothetical protein BJ508DRAFT_325796 [Ascobolus immersus RN42]|uniref:Uncharacterized protein n=1 Tax=Ascobolus immersus RN42 TaxID=1160509 RepID=A0A3N4IK56_ASCIM|nr:hypothetical protein BJ508DRAFT_325796 [Ascobolus immersus RN42]
MLALHCQAPPRSAKHCQAVKTSGETYYYTDLKPNRQRGKEVSGGMSCQAQPQPQQLPPVLPSPAATAGAAYKAPSRRERDGKHTHIIHIPFPSPSLQPEKDMKRHTPPPPPPPPPFLPLTSPLRLSPSQTNYPAIPLPLTCRSISLLPNLNTPQFPPNLNRPHPPPSPPTPTALIINLILLDTLHQPHPRHSPSTSSFSTPSTPPTALVLNPNRLIILDTLHQPHPRHSPSTSSSSTPSTSSFSTPSTPPTALVILLNDSQWLISSLKTTLRAPEHFSHPDIYPVLEPGQFGPKVDLEQMQNVLTTEQGWRALRTTIRSFEKEFDVSSYPEEVTATAATPVETHQQEEQSDITMSDAPPSSRKNNLSQG